MRSRSILVETTITNETKMLKWPRVHFPWIALVQFLLVWPLLRGTLFGTPLSGVPASVTLSNKFSEIVLESPNKSVAVHFSLKSNPLPQPKGVRPYYWVTWSGKRILRDSSLGLTLEESGELAENLEILTTTIQTIDETYVPVLGSKSPIRNHCRQLTIEMRERSGPGRLLGLVFRAYDEGIAFRYRIPQQLGLGGIKLSSENSTFNLPPGSSAWAQSLGSFTTNYEKEYFPMQLWEIQPDSILGLPMLIKSAVGVWMGLTEAAIHNYPGMYLSGIAGVPDALISKLSPLPDDSRHAVRSKLPVVTPWRVLLLANHPGLLIENNWLLMNLNAPCSISDTSWIKPGKAAWHWWSGTVAKHVNFEPGMNDATLRHYVDFASANRLEYVQIDEGWYFSQKGTTDITRCSPGVDIAGLSRYAAKRNVLLLVWLNWKHLKAQIEQALPLYESWGIGGIKVDFMDRDDQMMVNFYDEVVQKAAQHRLLVNFHGAFKPDGSQRTWPNLITREAVLGLEWSRTGRRCSPDHELTLPFTRMLAGPMDFTPGAFHNATQQEFLPRSLEPMAQGTRAHQLAMYVVFESPLQMLVDYPEAYIRQTGLEFLRQVPTVWDETRFLVGEIGDYIVLARRGGRDWYVGGMTDWTARKLTIPLEFLPGGNYEAEMYSDGVVPKAVELQTLRVDRTSQIEAKLAPGGGCVMRVSPAGRD